MQFTPKSKSEIDQEVQERIEKAKPWAKGEYPCEVVDAKETRSNAGNEMIVLEIKVFNQDGDFKSLKYYIVNDQHDKLYAACEAFGLLERYEAGQLDSYDFVNKEAEAVLKIKRGDIAPDGGRYPDKNEIHYLVAPKVATKSPSPARAASREDLEDSIPF